MNVRRWMQRALVALVGLGAATAVLAEGSRTLMPSTYPAAGGRGNLSLRNPATLYAGVAQERQFIYVYAEAGEYILVGTSNRATVGGTTGNGDVLIYDPANFGTRGNETRPGTSSFNCAATTPPAGSFSGTGRGIISSRTAELAGPNSVDGSATVAGGYSPCAYRAPTTGIYGVQFTGAANGTANPPNDLTTWAIVQNYVVSWDVTVRSTASTLSDRHGRVFTYAWVTSTTGLLYPTLYYATFDGYRYEQIMRGINPGAAVFFGNRAGFLDNGQPLYRDVRGTNQPVNAGFPAGITTQTPASPMFVSNIAGTGPNAAEVNKTLGALGIPLVPPTPQLTSPTYTGNVTGNRSTEGAGGVFTFNTVNTLTYEIVISRNGVDFDPANTSNRALTGTALTGTHSVPWDGNDNNGVPFPASGTPYTYRISGRNGEIHFPIIDIEGNANGGPTLRKLNGSGGTTVYFDDRGYVTRGGVAVGQLNGHLCGATNAQVQPSPTHSLVGVDSNAVTGSRYYRWWPGSSDPNTDCDNNASTYFGTAKALDLWALEKTTEFNQPIIVDPIPTAADVGTVVTMGSTALPGDTVFGTLSFSNNGATTATGVTYSFNLGTAGSCPTAATITAVGSAATGTYNPATCVFTFTGLPGTLASGVERNFNFQYTAPATGTVTATATIAATQDPLPGTNSPNTATAQTIIQVADLAISKTTSTPVIQNAPVTFTLRAWNNGPRPVSGASIFDNVPASITGVTWTCTAVGNASCATASGTGNSVGVLANLGVDTGPTTTADTDYVQIVITGTPTTLGALSNSASIAAPNGTSDPTPGNNSATSSSTVIEGADLSLVKSDGGAVVQPGGNITYTLTVTNAGPASAASVSVSDTIPSGLTFVSATGTGWSCSQAAGTVTCTRATLAVGTAPAITLVLGVPANYSGTNPVSNTATVSATTVDPTPGNNSGSDTTAVQYPPDAVDDSATTPFGTAVPINVPGNDVAGSAPLNLGSVMINTPAANGSLSVNTTTGVVTYTPTGNFSGIDSFTYTICDTHAPTPLCDTATVTIAVGPDAVNDTASTPFNTQLNASVTGNDSAPANAVYSVSGPTPSGLVFNANGSYTYTPPAGTTGPVSFNYQVCLPSPNQTLCDIATVTIVVGPDANNDTQTIAYGATATGSVTGNDTAPVGSTYSVVTQPPGGGLTFNPDGSYSYVPPVGTVGPVTFTYQVCLPSPNQTVCDSATVTIIVGPQANDDSTTVATGGTATGSVTGNDTAPVGSTYAVVTPPPGGGLTFNPDGSYTYTPPTGTVGLVTFTYQVCLPSPNQTVCDDATVTIVVGPEANDDSNTVASGGTATGNVSGNDTAPAGSTYSVVTPPPGGGLVLDPDGSYTYTPPAGTSGPVSFIYELCLPSPNQTACDEATVTIVVGPQGNDDTNSTPQNTPVAGNVTGNDFAPNDATYAVVTQPGSGSLTFNADGSYVYQPAPGFTGDVTFVYEVCLAAPNDTLCDEATVTITVGANSVNAQPDTDATAQNTAVTTVVLQNDVVGANGAPLDPGSVTIVTPSPNGTATPNPDGTVTFTPAPNFSGTTTYTYEVCDTSSPTPVCAQAEATITVAPNTVDAGADGGSTAQNTPVTIPVLVNDTVLPNGAPLDPGSVTVTVPSPNGTATVNPDGSITFVPANNFSGTATFTYEVCDTSVPTPVCDTATVQVLVGNNLVGAVNDNADTAQNTPVTTPVLGNDTTTGAPLNPASVVVTVPSPNGTATPNPDGTITFTPAPDFSGTTTYTYQVCDSSTPTPVCDTAVVTVVVAPNTVSALNDVDSTPQNTPVTTSVLVNDSTPPTGAPLDPGSVSITTPSPNGTLVVNPDGTIEFTPATNFSGTTSYTYEVCDTSTPTPVCDTAVVTITVGVNTLDAQNDTDTTPQNTPVTTDVLFNDSSTGAALDPSSVTIVAQSDDGNAFVNPDGSITFTPDPGFSGTTTYTYQVCDLSTPTPVCAAALVTITVEPNVIDAQNDTDTTPQNTPVTTSVLGNDVADPTGAPLNPGSVSIVTQSPNGTAVANANGTITFTPNPGFTGVATYTYQVCDTSTPTPVCDTAQVQVTVQPNVFTALNDNDTTPQNTPVTTPVLGNDTVLPNGAPIDPGSVTVTVPSPNGTTQVNPDGSITFTPADNFSGTTTYTYEVCDTSTPTPVCGTAVVSVTVGSNSLQIANDNDVTPQNTTVVTSVLANDGSTGAPLNPASVTIVAQSANGTATPNPDGTISFVPATNFSGTTTYTYEVCDISVPTPVCDIAIVTVSVGANLVAASNDKDSTPQNTPVTTNVLVNDSSTGAPLNPASVTVTAQSPNGTATANPDGTITFVPNPGFSGTAIYSYQVCDTSSPTPICASAQVTILVSPNNVNAADDSDTTPQNTPVTTVVLINDTTTGAALAPGSVTIVTQSPNGTAVPNADGTITFTPTPGFSGTTAYTYEVCDTSLPTPVCDTAIVTIVIAPNDVDALNDADNTPQNTPVTTSVLNNDTTTGAPLNPASVTITTQSPNGTAVANANGTITFTPNTNFTGVTTYSYQVCDTSTPTPLCDIAVVTITVGASTVTANNDFDTTPQNTPVTTTVLGNDSSSGAPLVPGSITIVTPSPDGTATPNPDGTITFVPNAGFSGTTTYVYQVCDASTPTPVCDTALVTITVPPNSVNALNDNDSTPQNTPVTVPVLGNDSSTSLPLDPGSVVVTVQSPNGTTFVNPDGTITFTPNPGFSGVTTFTYRVCDTSAPVPVCDDAIVTITVGNSTVNAVDDSDTTPQNTPVTVIVLGNDTSSGPALNPGSVAIVAPSADGTATVNPDGSIVFTPNPGFSGTTTFTYVVCDTSTPTPQCDTALVTIVVGASTVVANDDEGTTPQDTPITTPVINNDTTTGPPLNPGSVTIVVPSPNGNLVVNPDGSITFTPTPGFSGTTTYTYRVCDTSTPVPVCDTAIVTIIVGPGAITAVDDTDTTAPGVPVTTNVLDNDSASQPLDPSSVTITVPSPNGDAVVNPDGSITFTPAPGFSGTTTYTYRVCDTSTPTPLCDTAVVTITVPAGATVADLDVLKTGPASADRGEQVTFTIVVNNLGPDLAEAVVLSDPTPTGLVFVGNTGDCTTAFPCALGDLPVGESRTVLATFLVPQGYTGPATITNVASVSSNTVDPTPGDTSSSASTVVQGGGTGPNPVAEPQVIPVDGRLAMLLLVLSVMLLAGVRIRRN